MKPAQPGKEPTLTINQFHYEVLKRLKFLDLIKAAGLRNFGEFRGPALIKETGVDYYFNFKSVTDYAC